MGRSWIRLNSVLKLIKMFFSSYLSVIALAVFVAVKAEDGENSEYYDYEYGEHWTKCETEVTDAGGSLEDFEACLDKYWENKEEKRGKDEDQDFFDAWERCERKVTD